MLDDKLIEYSKSNIYPFHMPGHKRQPIDFPNPYTIDITEIDGFDNLHHAQEILKDAEERAAQLYGAKRSFYLVNGSTCGILASICAATKKGGQILVARNSHKAVYHSIFLQELNATYLYPEITRLGIQGMITPEAVEAKLQDNPEIHTVVITSPTYDGVVSDIQSIAKVVHNHGAVLIVDEAHGAHFGFDVGFPENAVKLGADAVIVSLHKTLPSFTQTALLHLCSDRISEARVEKYLGIFETSSPSYLFMAGMEKCIRMLKENGKQLFAEYKRRLGTVYKETYDLVHLSVMHSGDLAKEEAFDFDIGKLLIFPDQDYLNGKQLYDLLLEKYQLQMEMVTDKYVVAMTSIMDTDEGFSRLLLALKEIDCELSNQPKRKHPVVDSFSVYTEYETAMTIAEAEDAKQEQVPWADAVGRIAANSVYLYPPGIPIIVPGEQITEKFVQDIEQCMKMGLDVEGLPVSDGINVVN